MENLSIYNAVRVVPKEAQKEIKGGRLKGMTDINPMWRIKALTEQFGACGIGWKYEIVNKWVETAMAKDEITANVEINLYIKVDDKWSEPIPGVGGSMLVANERNGLYVNDECYKMALTDAISVACKALGMGADIYWGNDNTKYNDSKRENVQTKAARKNSEPSATGITAGGVDYITQLCIQTGTDPAKVMSGYKVNSFYDLTMEQYTAATKELERRLNK
jgi:hypothetical protein